MRYLVTAAAAMLLLSGPALAQNQDPPKSWGHFFGGIGGLTSGGSGIGVYHVGGGGGGLIAGGLGINAEVGVISNFSRSVVGAFTPGVFYAFKQDSELSPFIGGGYSMVFRDEALHGFYAGGGANYWMNDSLGLRFEVRTHVYPEGNTLFLIEARVGLLLH